MPYILFDQHWGQYEFIALLRPGLSAADIIEWVTNWGPQEGEGWEWGPGAEQPQLWGELYELITTQEPGKYDCPEDDTYIGEWGRFTDGDGVTNLLFEEIKLEFSFDYDDIPAGVRYGKVYFPPTKCLNWEVEQEKYDNGKCPCCRCLSPGGIWCSSCLRKKKNR